MQPDTVLAQHLSTLREAQQQTQQQLAQVEQQQQQLAQQQQQLLQVLLRQQGAIQSTEEVLRKFQEGDTAAALLPARQNHDGTAQPVA